MLRKDRWHQHLQLCKREKEGPFFTCLREEFSANCISNHHMFSFKQFFKLETIMYTNFHSYFNYIGHSHELNNLWFPGRDNAGHRNAAYAISILEFQNMNFRQSDPNAKKSHNSHYKPTSLKGILETNQKKQTHHPSSSTNAYKRSCITLTIHMTKKEKRSQNCCMLLSTLQ